MASVVGAYARAFADVVVGSKLDPARSLQELHSIEDLLQQSVQFRRVMDNPSIPGESKRGVLDGIAKRLGMARQARNFVAVVTDHRRLGLFAEIVKQVEQELNHRLGFADAEVSSARELGVAEKELLEAEIAKLTGRRVRARYQRDSSLIGGAVIKVGSTIYDGSVKGQLESIRQKLISS